MVANVKACMRGLSRLHWLRWEELPTLGALVHGWDAGLHEMKKSSTSVQTFTALLTEKSCDLLLQALLPCLCDGL